MPHLESVALGDLGQVRIAQRTRRRAWHCPSARAHGLQGHGQPHRRPDRRGNRECRRRDQRRDQRRDHVLLCPRAARRRAAGDRHPLRHPDRIRHSTRTNWSASSMSSCRRSARRTTRRTTSSSTASPETAFRRPDHRPPILGTPETVSPSASGRRFAPIIDAPVSRAERMVVVGRRARRTTTAFVREVETRLGTFRAKPKSPVRSRRIYRRRRLSARSAT